MDRGAAWDVVPERMSRRGHYLDAFLGEMKRQANLELVIDWSDDRETEGRVLKTDLFEEALGPDAFLHLLRSVGRMVVGIDLSVAVAARARRNDALRECHLLAADARQLPFRESSFSLVVSPSTLDHFQNPADLGVSLKELRRTTVAHGRMVVTLDNRQNIFDPLLRLAIRFGLVPYFIGRSYSARELRRELAEAGWVVRETTAIVHNPRLVAVGLVALGRWLNWPPFTRFVRWILAAMQRLGDTRWRDRSGCFVAALAAPAGDIDSQASSK